MSPIAPQPRNQTSTATQLLSASLRPTPTPSLSSVWNPYPLPTSTGTTSAGVTPFKAFLGLLISLAVLLPLVLAVSIYLLHRKKGDAGQKSGSGTGSSIYMSDRSAGESSE